VGVPTGNSGVGEGCGSGSWVAGTPVGVGGGRVGIAGVDVGVGELVGVGEGVGVPVGVSVSVGVEVGVGVIPALTGKACVKLKRLNNSTRDAIVKIVLERKTEFIYSLLHHKVWAWQVKRCSMCTKPF